MEIYRYRSMKSLLDFKELENQEIYLARPKEIPKASAMFSKC